MTSYHHLPPSLPSLSAQYHTNKRVKKVPQTHRHLPTHRRTHIRVPRPVRRTFPPPTPTAPTPLLVVLLPSGLHVRLRARRREQLTRLIDLYRCEPDLPADGGGDPAVPE